MLKYFAANNFDGKPCDRIAVGEKLREVLDCDDVETIKQFIRRNDDIVKEIEELGN